MKMESESEQKEFRHCKKMACPGNPKQLMSVLRLFSYLSSHIVNYAKLTKPLWDLQRAEKWNWTEECEKAFKKIKEVIVHASTIGFLDPHKELYLYTDASQDAIAGILTQVQNGKHVMIDMLSKVSLPCQTPWLATELLLVDNAPSHKISEGLANVKGIIISRKPLASIGL